MAPVLQTAAARPLQGLRVAVTGGTSGLGLALVRQLIGHGAAVAFVARTAARVMAVARAHPGTHGIVGDIARRSDIHRLAVQITGNLGGLDVLVNNASSLGPVPLALLADTEDEDLERALATNVLGPFRLTRALLGALAASAREGRGGIVLNVSSDAALNAYASWGAYGASKAALLHMSRIWDEELASEGVRVLSVDPGDMDTPLHALAAPHADPGTLKRPDTAARELADLLVSALPPRWCQASNREFSELCSVPGTTPGPGPGTVPGPVRGSVPGAGPGTVPGAVRGSVPSSVESPELSSASGTVPGAGGEGLG